MVRKHLEESGQKDYILLSFSDSEELSFKLEDQARANIYILDIDMPGKNGIELAEQIRETETNAIVYFYTSHSEYASEGYRVDVRRFIIKGGKEEYLREALVYACGRVKQLHEECVPISHFRDVIRIPVADIVYVERVHRQTVIHVQNGEHFITSDGLHDIYKRINKPYFVFIDRGIFINLDFVRRTDKDSVTLFGNIELKISRNRIAGLKEEIARYFHIR